MTTPTTTPKSISRDQLTGTWQLDPAHTRLGFSAKHAMVTTVRGGFTDAEGTLHLDGANPANSRAEVAVKAASFDSGNDQRDEHVRGADFLDVEKYPEITFRSTRVEQGRDADEFVLYGDLAIRGVTREVRLELEFQGATIDPWGNLRAGFEGGTTISRKDWNLTWNVALEAGGILVSDKIKISLDVSAVKQA